ncbi:MAG TPA: adenylate/guanylate cyclase domain-containing protein [Solirubrobacteraceae bacterium]|jgi:adenylate cyclase
MAGEDGHDSHSEEQRRRSLRTAAVRADTQPRLLEVARWLRRRLPGDDRFGDVLSTAGSEPAQVLARGVSSLQPARDSVAHELGLGALQVWQALSEASGRGRGTTDVALLFTDLVGFSSWALQAGDEPAVELLRQVGEAVEGSVLAHDGDIVKRLGDGVMAVFRDPEQAIEAALDGHEKLELIEVAGHRPRMRTGVHVGRPRRLGGDYLGVDVNVAARIGAAAGPRELLASETVTERLDEERFRISKGKRLKAPGTPKELRVCRVERQPSVR